MYCILVELPVPFFLMYYDMMSPVSMYLIIKLCMYVCMYIQVVTTNNYYATADLFFFPLALQPTFGPWPTSMKFSVSLQFTRSWTFGKTPWTGDKLVARPLPVHKHRKTHIHKH
jgi:hypothetical protein